MTKCFKLVNKSHRKFPKTLTLCYDQQNSHSGLRVHLLVPYCTLNITPIYLAMLLMGTEPVMIAF